MFALLFTFSMVWIGVLVFFKKKLDYSKTKNDESIYISLYVSYYAPWICKASAFLRYSARRKARTFVLRCALCNLKPSIVFSVEDLNLNAVESLHGVPYVAVGKHLCGPATDLSLRCCLSRQDVESPVLRGLAIATCCHHLCQWKSYINKEYIISLGMSKDEFHTVTWFTSWAVDDDHGSKIPGVDDIDLLASDAKEEEQVKEVEDDSVRSVDEVVKKMKPMERAVLGFKCKQIIDAGRMRWVKKHGLDSKLVKYIPASISPENTLLIAGKSTPSFA